MEPSSATEPNDDGLLLIVVGDEDTKSKSDIKIECKIESSVVDDAEMVVETLEEYIDDDVKSEVNDSDDEDDTNLPDLGDESSDEEIDYEEIDRKPAFKSRRTKIQPAQKKSFVSDLRQQNPEFQEDKELLIDNLSQIMANFKCPAPPPNFFLQNDNKFECRNCGLKKDTKMAVARHWQDRHGPRCFVCYACGLDFRSQTNLYKHEKRCISDDALIVLKARGRIKKYKGTCPGRPFHLPDAYHDEKTSFINCLRQSHPELVQDREQLIKMVCDKMAEEIPPHPPQGSVVNLSKNMYQCTKCGLQNASYKQLLRHWQCSHGPRYLLCFACGTTYSDPRNLYKHEKRCTEPDACVVLEARARRLRGRGRGRPAPPPAPLPHAPDGGERYPCKECPAVYRTAKYLVAHELSHAGLRPYPCESCPAKYTSANALSRHRQLHKDKTFLCPHCAKTFRTKELLRSHLNTHLPQRKYACGQCSKRYAQKFALQVHVDRDHLHLPPRCACQLCPKRYPRMSLLKEHMLKKHGMTIITRQMFYKTLPHLTDSQLKNAKIIKKSELNPADRHDQNSSNKTQGSEENTSPVEENQEIAQRVFDDDDDDVEFVEDDSTQTTQLNKGKVDQQNSETQAIEKRTTQINQNDEKVPQEISETQIVEDKDNGVTQISEEQDDTPKDLLEYAKQIQHAETNNTKPLIIIKDGQAVFVDKNNVDFYKRKLRKRKNSQVEILKQSLITDVENIMRNEPELESHNDSINPMLQEEEIISQTNRVVTMRNCVNAKEQQICPSPKIATGKRRKRRKQCLK